MLKDLDITPDNPAELRAVNRLLADEVKALSLKVEQLQHQLHGANRHRFGTKSEGLDQLNLDLQEDAEIVEAAEAQTKAPDPAKDVEKPKRKHSRKPLPDHLDREDEELSPGNDCGKCGGTLRTLGEDVTEELEYVPGRFKVKRIIRPRKACSCCEVIVQAPLPSRPIERGRPGPGLLAHVLVSKYADHLPLYRLSQIFAREGVDLDRSTMTDWVGRSTALLEPLADDTPVKMLAPGNKKAKTARVWTYVRDERPWSGSSPPCAWYQFTVDRKGEHPVSHLSGYRGWVHGDGYSGFNGVFGEDKADEMACLFGSMLCMRLPGSTWPMSDASSWMSSRHRAVPSLNRPSCGSLHFMPSRGRSGFGSFNLVHFVCLFSSRSGAQHRCRDPRCHSGSSSSST